MNFNLGIKLPQALQSVLSGPKSPSEFDQAFRDPFKRTAFFLGRIPALAFFGVEIKTIDASRCEILLPFTWRTQNPFGSVYFAAQVAAAELASGALLLRGLTDRSQTSMLVTALSGQFTKKAKGDVTFTCEQGSKITEAIEKSETGQEVTVEVESIGRLHDGTEVSRFQLTWSVRKKLST